MHTPHDRFFHHVFSNPEHARGELALLLGDELSRRIDWSTLRALPARFVEPLLSEQRSDVLFAVQSVDARPLLLYVLFEHQSTVDAWMPLRLLGYLPAIWKRHLAEHEDCTRLPLIVPLVLHHSEGGWTAAVRFRDIVDADAELLALTADQLPDFRFILEDISRVRDEELRGRTEPVERLDAETLRRRRVLEEMERMSTAELVALAVRAGILDDLCRARSLPAGVGVHARTPQGVADGSRGHQGPR